MDFDGTVTQQDVGEEVFRKFAKEEKVNIIIDDLLNDRISSRECWINLCGAVPSVNKDEFDDFIASTAKDFTLADVLIQRNHTMILTILTILASIMIILLGTIITQFYKRKERGENET